MESGTVHAQERRPHVAARLCEAVSCSPRDRVVPAGAGHAAERGSASRVGRSWAPARVADPLWPRGRGAELTVSSPRRGRPAPGDTGSSCAPARGRGLFPSSCRPAWGTPETSGKAAEIATRKSSSSSPRASWREGSRNEGFTGPKVQRQPPHAALGAAAAVDQLQRQRPRAEKRETEEELTGCPDRDPGRAGPRRLPDSLVTRGPRWPTQG